MLYSTRGLDILWRNLSQEDLLYEGSDVTGLKFFASLAESGLTPCLVANLGSAMTVVKVSKTQGVYFKTICSGYVAYILIVNSKVSHPVLVLTC